MKSLRKCATAGTFGILALIAAAPLAASEPKTEANRVVVEAPAKVAALIKDIRISYDTFTLSNGLRVIVHTDRRAKVVTVGVDYLVGSRSEPPKRTGFAHLFEHLMFNGSENAPGDYSLPLQKLGAELNGVTLPDRTRYWETVPTPGLEQALFLESDRMGYLLGAVTQKKLDEQRSVVQNEKRQSDNRPLARVRYDIYETLYPAGHPDAHGVFGSMADLDAATLDDVREWFTTHYGPNNAILSLSGDIDVATARALAEKYFGGIAAGPVSTAPTSAIPVLPDRIDRTLYDRTPTPRLYRSWAVPGSGDPSGQALEVAIGVMMRGDSSYLKRQLIEREMLFSSTSAEVDMSDHSGRITISGTLREGVDPVKAGARLDAAIAETLRRGAAAGDVADYITGDISQRILVLASPSGMLNALGEGFRLGKGPDYYRQKFQALEALTPLALQRTAVAWLGRPVYALTVLPGTPPPFETAAGPKSPATTAETVAKPGTRGGLPPVGTFSDIEFPKTEHRRLKNGIDILYIDRGDAPLTDIIVDFDAGSVAEPLDRLGVQAMLIGLLGQGTTSRSAAAIARQRTRLGMNITTDVDEDRTTFRLSVPSANLRPGLQLLADTLINPALDPVRIDAERTNRSAEIRAGELDGSGRMMQVFGRKIDADSAYAARQDGATVASVGAITRNDLIAFGHAWLRPDKATIYVVSNRPFAEILPAIERDFGGWVSTGVPGSKPASTVARPAPAGIVVIDQPGADQSFIIAGQTVSFANAADQDAAMLANTALGSSFASRLNTELRQVKGWSYGVQGRFESRALDTRYLVTAPVQQDKTGDTIRTIRQLIADFRTTRPLTPGEFDLAVDSETRALSVRFRDTGAYVEAIRENRRLHRPDDRETQIAARYRAVTLSAARSALRAAIDPATFNWVVLGDAASVRPQLEDIGLPVTVLASPAP